MFFSLSRFVNNNSPQIIAFIVILGYYPVRVEKLFVPDSNDYAATPYKLNSRSLEEHKGKHETIIKPVSVAEYY